MCRAIAGDAIVQTVVADVSCVGTHVASRAGGCWDEGVQAAAKGSDSLLHPNRSCSMGRRIVVVSAVYLGGFSALIRQPQGHVERKFDRT
eukprot:1586784-Rhodomonas_salina.4